jgi:uncharacterized protein (DUF4415 family)
MPTKKRSRTDWNRLNRMTDAEIAAAAAADPDNPVLNDSELAELKLVMPAPTQAISIRLDDQVVDWFKRQGPGYQTRINAVLRAYIEARRRKRA